ncbi:MAG TPA: hypothetical protein VFU05_07295 [Cyclobacteriaceae bacterium]|nr:hypothetical protein [Cyclobacteriaceae bacterium]
MMRSKIRLVIIFTLLSSRAFSQEVVLFKSTEPISLRATGSIKSIKKNSNDSTLVAGKFEYQHGDEWITVPVSTRVRGNFRLKNCYFPPLKLKFKKQQAASTVFEGNKSLKLVMPCKNTSDKDKLIRREYLCYKFYQALSPYYFNTRLATFELTEVSRKKPRTYTMLTFFVEDNSLVAKRTGGVVTEVKGVGPGAFEEKQSVRNDFFQFMIGNADWSAVYQHNSNTLVVNKKLIPLSYDFDMSGFVNAAYAQAKPTELGTGDVRERVYRGFCKSKPVMQEVREEFLQKESLLYSIIDQHAEHFRDYDMRDMKGYLKSFFDILRKDHSFQQSIVEQCRTK